MYSSTSHPKHGLVHIRVCARHTAIRLGVNHFFASSFSLAYKVIFFDSKMIWHTEIVVCVQIASRDAYHLKHLLDVRFVTAI